DAERVEYARGGQEVSGAGPEAEGRGHVSGDFSGDGPQERAGRRARGLQRVTASADEDVPAVERDEPGEQGRVGEPAHPVAVTRSSAAQGDELGGKKGEEQPRGQGGDPEHRGPGSEPADHFRRVVDEAQRSFPAVHHWWLASIAADQAMARRRRG